MKKSPPPHDPNPLTPSEKRVCEELVYSPRSFKEIAAHFGRSPHTIRTQCERIYRKLGVQSRAELVAKIRGSGEEPPTNPPPAIATSAGTSPITRTVVRKCQTRNATSLPCTQ